jgi:hypothetical protein
MEIGQRLNAQFALSLRLEMRKDKPVIRLRAVKNTLAGGLAAALLVVAPMLAAAQDATPVPTTTGPTNNVQGNFVACDTNAVINLNGTLLTNFDVYYQVFAGAAGSGTPLTNLRQVSLAGTFTFSERITYNAGATVAAGGSASAKVIVARETDASRVDFEFVIADVQDGCTSAATQPQNPVGSSVDAGSGATGSTGSTSGTTAATFQLPAPNGRVLNPNLPAEPAVVLGARVSDTFRSETPGLIYAACQNFARALPGLIYDNDRITVYWSWFTRTRAQMDDHLANVNYSVRLNRATFNDVVRSEIEQRDGLFYVFYSVDVGFLRPGHYEVEYRATWANPVNDGFDDFGPGTDNFQDAGNCNFDVRRNPNSEQVSYTDMFLPTNFPVHQLISPDAP